MKSICERWLLWFILIVPILKKVFLTDLELHQLNERIAKSHFQNFSVYDRKVLLNLNMSFVTINTDTYDQFGLN